MKRTGVWLGVTSAAVLCLSVVSGVEGQQAPDNSKQNQQQVSTAQNQSNATSDLQTTAQVRKLLIADKTLSTYAHNVKIITRAGQVTLKGPVKSEQEKQEVETDVVHVVSADKVTNELTVKQ